MTADRQYIAGETTFHGFPLVPVETVTERFPPERYSLLVTIGYSRMRSRRDMFLKGRSLGYHMPGYAAPGARLLRTSSSARTT